jgi:hypothetical protein
MIAAMIAGFGGAVQSNITIVPGGARRIGILGGAQDRKLSCAVRPVEHRQDQTAQGHVEARQQHAKHRRFWNFARQIAPERGQVYLTQLQHIVATAVIQLRSTKVVENCGAVLG